MTLMRRTTRTMTDAAPVYASLRDGISLDDPLRFAAVSSDAPRRSYRSVITVVVM